MANRYEVRVLVVDDEVDTCRNLSDILSDLGYQVDWACDGESALELVRRQPYDVALLDLRMPGMDGLTLYREIKKIRAGTVAILVTAYASGATSQEALAAGAWQVVPKPVHLPRLLELVDQAYDQPLVLLVDDDRDLCENLWLILRDRGYRVALAHDAAEAAAQLREANVRIALIDMKLPGSHGTEVFDLVREADPTIRTVLITGWRSEMNEIAARLQAREADAACYKPFDVPKLLETLDQLTQATQSSSTSLT